MQWPWVNRASLEAAREHQAAAFDRNRALRKMLRDLRERLRESRDRTTAAEAQADVLRHELQLAQTERAELQLKLLRVSFGINPFTELQETSAVPEAPQPPNPTNFGLGPMSTPEEVQATFVREGLELYGGDARKLARHVEQRQAEFYAGRKTPPVLGTAQTAAALRVHDDLLASIAEGRKAAQGEN